MDITMKRAYYTLIPYTIRIKIKRIKHRKTIDVSKTYFDHQETQFKNHTDNLIFDDQRRTDILRIFSLLRKNGFDVFPEIDDAIRAKYFTRKLNIEKDHETNLFYILIDNKKLFYKNGMNETTIKQSFDLVSLEQDYRSPHRYLTNDNYFVGVVGSDSKQFNGDSFGINEGDVVVDAGAAEGNFALSVVEKASKVYIIEGDAEWCKALKQTFAPYKEKVEIIQKYLSDNTNDNNITLKDLIKKYNIKKIDFLKMDIEGYEQKALNGATLDKTNFTEINKMAICIYHNPQDETTISNFLAQYGYKFYLTDGYIVISDSNNPIIRKGILRAYKEQNHKNN
ncbi:FkbM family methyltransferase [Candidatus Bathycorpusculum sp.]|uniref:FkbM family methyltransferase n=1 Tax=Candidatus Bathycorpusculum sp. TaxID=2994959 RepID=UPI002821FA45|nr:FkbM family methyltransferase [Candidatus Termitimicrobium sp.]MCL2431736.1 FkbM family methyltransferase [Candidatus Termitimicrobium sp.]